MIFVAVGTQKFQFNRLLESIDDLIENKMITEEVYAQIGHSDYVPQNYKYTNFLSKDEFELYINKCNILITHSGVGTIISGIKCKKPVIVMPRLAKYGEHVDDHQVQIANSFEEKNYVLCVGEKKKLQDMIQEAYNHKFDQYISQRENVLRTIRTFIDSI